MTDKKTLTPTEFAALFGREKTWSYRMLYAGKIKALTEYGRIMIPASEADRLAGEASLYQVKEKASKKPRPVPAVDQPKERVQAKGGDKWAAVVANHRKGTGKQTGGKNPPSKRTTPSSALKRVFSRQPPQGDAGKT